jgi:hypothetical protein
MKLVTKAVDVEGLVDLLESLKKKQDETEAADTEGDKTLWDALDAWTEVGEIEKVLSSGGAKLAPRSEQ